MKKLLSFLPLILCLLIQNGFSQNTVDKAEFANNITIKLNYSNTTSKSFTPPITNFNNYGSQSGDIFDNKNAQFEIQGLYKFSEYLSAGIYTAYSKGTFIKNEIEYPNPNMINVVVEQFGSSFYYGIKSELQLLPILIKDSKLRLNVYCPMQLGLVSQQVTTLATNSKSWDKPALEIGAGLGISYNITKNIGIFGEYQLGHFYNNRNSQWKVGVLVTF